MTAPFGALRGGRDDDAVDRAHRRQRFGIAQRVGEVRRADLLLALGEQDEVDRQPPAGGAEGVERGEEGAFGALLVDRAAAADRAALRQVDDPPLERRRRPFRRVELLDVVHEIDADRAPGAGVDPAEHDRAAAGRDLADAGEPRLGGEPRHVIGAFLDVELLGGDGRQRDPLLDAPHAVLVAGIDGGTDRVAVAGAARLGEPRGGREQGGGGGGAGEQAAAVGRKAVGHHVPLVVAPL